MERAHARDGCKRHAGPSLHGPWRDPLVMAVFRRGRAACYRAGDCMSAAPFRIYALKKCDR